ncbi:MAG TPA: tripartite tricarboxylate transporter TctB family protein [Beijerinckiaceae bacterium]
MVVDRRRGEVVVGLALVAFGVTLTALAWRMPAGSVSLPGPGFMPSAVGILLALTGLGCTLRTMTANDAPGTVSLGRLNAWGALATLAVVAFLFEPLGAPLTLALAMTALFRLAGGYRLVRCALSGVIAAAVAWLVFTRLLGVGLPAGILPL